MMFEHAHLGYELLPGRCVLWKKLQMGEWESVFTWHMMRYCKSYMSMSYQFSLWGDCKASVVTKLKTLKDFNHEW